jgi:beta-N-acetylhexosaminidase
MLLVGFADARIGAASAIAADIRERGLGGVVLFDRDQLTGGARNISSPDQLRRLCADLQALAADAKLGGPLIIATDQEGGAVARLSPANGFPATTSAADLGKRDDPAFTRRVAASMAATLARAGVNFDLAPVVDVNVNPRSPAIGALGRSFSADPAIVAEQAAAFVRGMHAHGIRTALKHFPGHGSARADTHRGVADVTNTWQHLELDPYRRLLADGLIDSVLVAHVFNANLDPELPASLSKATITDLLRGQIGFAGLVVTDDLQMGAITGAFGFEEALALAIEAGADLLVLANQQVVEAGVVGRAIDAIEGHVASGRLTAAQIEAAATRVDAFRTGLLGGPA